jgi:hypothetical protein
MTLWFGNRKGGSTDDGVRYRRKNQNAAIQAGGYGCPHPTRELCGRVEHPRTWLLGSLALFRTPSYRLLHLDFHAHPRMDAALETMLAFRQTRDPQIAALNDSSLGHLDVLKTTAAFRHGFLPGI